jgi:hypothetical protein
MKQSGPKRPLHQTAKTVKLQERDMVSVQDIYDTPRPDVGLAVHVSGILLGTGFENQFLADSPEGYEGRIALPIMAGSLFEQLCESGVSPIGGGRFSFWYKAVVQGDLVLANWRGFKFGLANIVSLIVGFRDKEITVIPGAYRRSSAPAKPSTAHLHTPPDV